MQKSAEVALALELGAYRVTTNFVNIFLISLSVFFWTIFSKSVNFPINYNIVRSFSKNSHEKILRYGENQSTWKWGREPKIDRVNVLSREAARLPPTAKSENPTKLGAPTELEALLLAFGSTIGTYLLAKDEDQTPSELRERWLWFLDRIFLFRTCYIPVTH